MLRCRVSLRTGPREPLEFLRNNIILAGGGSLIEGLAEAVAEGLADIGDVSVWCAEDPVTKVAEGALALAGDMPDDQFTSIN